MSGIIFDSGNLSETLSTIIGFKTGLVLSLDDLIEHTDNDYYKDTLQQSEIKIIRLETTEFDEIYYGLLYRLGFTNELQNRFPLDKSTFRNTHRSAYEEILKLYSQIMPDLIEKAIVDGTKLIDPTIFIVECNKSRGELGVKIGIEMLENINSYIGASPFTDKRFYDFQNGINLKELYIENNHNLELGKFFDQRLIDYLCHNSHKLSSMHWRKFEAFVAEYFYKQGYKVELGPGRNDDGVDIRIWRDADNAIIAPLYIVQCKRQKDLIEKVVIKSLFADVTYAKAEYGLIVTTSDLSVGSKNTIKSRGYPIHAVNQVKLKEWLLKMRGIGRGIVKF